MHLELAQRMDKIVSKGRGVWGVFADLLPANRGRSRRGDQEVLLVRGRPEIVVVLLRLVRIKGRRVCAVYAEDEVRPGSGLSVRSCAQEYIGDRECVLLFLLTEDQAIVALLCRFCVFF